MAKKYSKVKKTLQVLGITALIFAGTLTLTGCGKELQTAQENIDTTVTTVLNSEEIQAVENAPFENFTFLCADVSKDCPTQYTIDINGVANYANSDKKAYTTFNYIVSDSYFSNEENIKNEAAIINTLADIVKNENYNSYSISTVKDLTALNNAMKNVTESPLDGYNPHSNFLYGVSNVQLSESDNVASFSTKELIKFSRTRTEVTYGITGYVDGKPKYGTIVRAKTDYESFFLDQNVYVQLTPEEMEMAKKDESIVFEKFAEYVKNDQKDKFVIQETNVAKDKEFDANMKDQVSLGDI